MMYTIQQKLHLIYYGWQKAEVLLLCFNFLNVIVSKQKLSQLQNSQCDQLRFLTKTREKVTVLKSKT